MALADTEHGTDKVCPDCAEIIKGAAKVCRYCGYRFDQEDAAAKLITASPIDHDGADYGQDVTDDDKPAGISILAFVGIIGAVGLGILGLATLGDASAEPSELETLEVNDMGLKADGTPDEVTAVTVCDMAIKGSLVSEGSYDPEFRWDYSAAGSVAFVSRKFDSQNGFGAKITSRYRCKWDAAADTIVSLEVTDPYGETRKLK
ncbi:hypothetical protein GR702_12580 [Novosphingobium sp. FGD1]|uniref:Uncharacterized protein n=1 Tax=Novosphingobium silvae TaxID=2692619 RepID=A0A7X4K714_9SPHN|nr:zinc ribbon domain-containing protein [Novosphingobium silvae]MYL98601.1 hypothetical protein [Novosphingobium silvae]